MMSAGHALLHRNSRIFGVGERCKPQLHARDCRMDAAEGSLRSEMFSLILGGPSIIRDNVTSATPPRYLS